MKSKFIAGEFSKSNFYDGGKDVDEFGIIKKPARDTTKLKKSTKSNRMSMEDE